MQMSQLSFSSLQMEHSTGYSHYASSTKFARLLFDARSNADLEAASAFGRLALASGCLDTSQDYGGFNALGSWICQQTKCSAETTAELFEILMASGASRRLNKFCLPLHAAMVNRNWVAFTLLMNRPEADLNARIGDADQAYTILMLAVSLSRAPYVQACCQRYWLIDFLLTNQNGETALMMANKLPFNSEARQIRVDLGQAMNLQNEYQKSVATELLIQLPRVLSNLVYGYFVMRSSK